MRPAAARGVVPMPFKRGHLRYFVTVAEEGQVTRAAERLHIAQPALSQAIAHLECDLGFQLLERHPRGVILTPAGEVFLEKARAVLAANEDAVLTAASLARTEDGTIALGYLGLPPASSDSGLVEAFSKAHPDIQLAPQELLFPSLPTASWLREVDAAICSRPAADPNVAFQALRAEPLIVLAPKGHPLAKRRELTVEELLDETFIGFHQSIDPAWAGFWSLDDYRGGQAPHVVGEATNPQQRFEMLAAGLGIAITPAYVAAIAKVLPGVVAIPLTDADTVIITLLARDDRQGRLVEALFATARQLAVQVSDDPLPAEA
jgi:DNA-binding transcriptional LysR family regulator